ncbi:hypothetical protein B0O80DRAFT_431841 [Mortierella sp. GBAus27b]|nr:hypothetical protein B0O80DRAFT_431841 [Mortierella sp. GBAus27b]
MYKLAQQCLDLLTDLQFNTLLHHPLLPFTTFPSLSTIKQCSCGRGYIPRGSDPLEYSLCFKCRPSAQRNIDKYYAGQKPHVGRPNFKPPVPTPITKDVVIKSVSKPTGQNTIINTVSRTADAKIRLQPFLTLPPRSSGSISAMQLSRWS